MTITLNKKYTRPYQVESMKALIKDVKAIYTVEDFLDEINRTHGNKYHGEVIKAKFEAFASNDYSSDLLSIQVEFYILDCVTFYYVRTYFHYSEEDGLTISEDDVLFTENRFLWQAPANNTPKEEEEEEEEEETPEELPEEDEAPTEDEEVEEYDDENDPYEFHDIETGEVLTRGQLYREYSRQKHKYPMEFAGISFGQHINNCLTRNGGTLERI